MVSVFLNGIEVLILRLMFKMRKMNLKILRFGWDGYEFELGR